MKTLFRIAPLAVLLLAACAAPQGDTASVAPEGGGENRLASAELLVLKGSEIVALQAMEIGVTSIEHASGFALAYQRLGGDLTIDEAPPSLEGILMADRISADMMEWLDHTHAASTPATRERSPRAISPT